MEIDIISLELPPFECGPGHFTHGYGSFVSKSNHHIPVCNRSRELKDHICSDKCQK